MCMFISAYIFAFYMIRYHEIWIFSRRYLCISVHISPYLCISVYMFPFLCISVYIRQHSNMIKQTAEWKMSLLNYTVQSAFAWLSSSDGMVCGPDHGPGVAVKEASVYIQYISISVHICAYVYICKYV